MFAGRTGRRRTLISLTPLIDVVFILLVFFMLASSFLNWRAIDLSLPPLAGGDKGLEGAMLVEVLPDGLRFGARPMDLPAIAARVEARLRQEPEQRVFVRPAAGVPLQRAVDVLDRLTAAGARNIALMRGAG